MLSFPAVCKIWEKNHPLKACVCSPEVYQLIMSDIRRLIGHVLEVIFPLNCCEFAVDCHLYRKVSQNFQNLFFFLKKVNDFFSEKNSIFSKSLKIVNLL